MPAMPHAEWLPLRDMTIPVTNLGDRQLSAWKHPCPRLNIAMALDSSIDSSNLDAGKDTRREVSAGSDAARFTTTGFSQTA
jgi:hypothetical protein